MKTMWPNIYIVLSLEYDILEYFTVTVNLSLLFSTRIEQTVLFPGWLLRQVYRMASSTNGLSDAEIQMNLKALKKVAFSFLWNTKNDVASNFIYPSPAGSLYPGNYGTQQPGSILFGNCYKHTVFCTQVQLYKYIIIFVIVS